MNLQVNSKSKEIAVHVIGSVLFLFVPFVMGPQGIHDLKDLAINPILQRETIEFTLILIFYYINYFLLIPKIYFPRKYLLYILILVSIFLVIAFIPKIFIPTADFGPSAINRPPVPPPFRPMHSHPLIDMRIIHDFFIFLAVIFFSIIIKTNNRLKLTEKEKLKSELQYLRAQINPHFLFNTLNSIYSLAIEKSDYTADAVVKLSGMMRYVISETDHDFVSLEKEINYLTDYVELQRLRLDNSNTVEYFVKGDALGKKVAPLILIPFVENAFKYGVNPEQVSKIHILVDITQDVLSLTVSNTIVYSNKPQNERTGLGIENAKTRLDLQYPQKYSLVFMEKDHTFEVNLTINLR
jgi:hypothetical protein